MSHPRNEDPETLSPRMIEVLASYARTGSWSATAVAVFLSEQTVKNYAHRAYQRLGVHDAIGAFRVLGWLYVP